MLGLDWAFRFRFLILLGVIGTFWLLLGNRRFTLFFGYIFAYPIVVIFWIIPRFAFRNWAVFVAFSPALYSIVSIFRTNFILFNAALISAFVICLLPNKLLIVICMGGLGAYLMRHFGRRFRTAFSTSTIFADFSGRIRSVWEGMGDSDMVNRLQDLNPGSDEYMEKAGQKILTIYMMTTVLYVLAERLQDVAESRKLDLYFLGSLLYTFLLTILVFATEYYGLERVAPGSFGGIAHPDLLDFVGYSFSTLMTSDISSLRPESGIAQALAYFQLFGSLVIIVLLVFVVLTSIRERYSQDLDGIVDELRVASNNMGGLMEANHKLTLAAAESWLLENNREATKWLLKLRYGEKRAKEIFEPIDVGRNAKEISESPDDSA